MQSNIGCILYKILFKSDANIIRLTLSIFSLVWALLLLCSYVDLNSIKLLRKIASPTIWGFIFLLQGAVMNISLLSGIQNRFTFIADALLGVIIWSFVTAAIFHETYTGGILVYSVYPIITCFSILLLIRYPEVAPKIH